MESDWDTDGMVQEIHNVTNTCLQAAQVAQKLKEELRREKSERLALEEQHNALIENWEKAMQTIKEYHNSALSHVGRMSDTNVVTLLDDCETVIVLKCKFKTHLVL